MNEYKPAKVSPPGATLTETILHQAAMDFAWRVGWNPEQFLRFLEGDIELTPKVASALALRFGPSAEFWLERERLYRESLKEQPKCSK